MFAGAYVYYLLADGSSIALFQATVAAGNNTVEWDMLVEGDRPDLGVEFRLPPVPGVKQAVTLQGYGRWSRSDRTAPLKPGDEPFTWILPEHQHCQHLSRLLVGGEAGR